MKLLDGLEVKMYKKEDLIIKEGDEGDYFYIIEEGKAECLKDEADPSLPKVHVRYLGAGEHFGEYALINNVQRTLSVKVVSDKVKVLALGRNAFNRILGNINRYLKKDYEGEFDKIFKDKQAREEKKLVSPNRHEAKDVIQEVVGFEEEDVQSKVQKKSGFGSYRMKQSKGTEEDDDDEEFFDAQTD
mmetsp:Transcript_42335/g.40574  ORF Transcript_42335/g.40574 Transcript_42335/m.40574 type:complete len:187 (+) Transcript_42335:1148-1708(+)